jgi:hypothetical protein
LASSFDLGDKGSFVQYETRKSAKMYFEHSLQYGGVISCLFAARRFLRMYENIQATPSAGERQVAN